MYRAKAAGRNAIHFFLPTMQEAADERLRLNTEIQKGSGGKTICPVLPAAG